MFSEMLELIDSVASLDQNLNLNEIESKLTNRVISNSNLLVLVKGVLTTLTAAAKREVLAEASTKKNLVDALRRI